MYKYINMSYLNEVSGGDISIKKEIIGMFFSQMKETSALLKESLSNGDYQKLSKVAHSAKSTLRVMGAEDLAKKMETLQNTAAQKESTENYPVLVNYFLENIPLVCQELESEISSSDVS
ncbi:MAG: Hpt domain-containing protein [Bacteroidales bacterium]|nr:Hpt domain-containing protein [Bacteroidales bacterium]